MHVLADFFIGDLGVDLRGADAGVAQDAAQGFDGDPLGKGECGEGVPGDVERDARGDAALASHLDQVVVAAVVARHLEDTRCVRVTAAVQDLFRNVEQKQVRGRMGLAAARHDPALSLEQGADIVPAQCLDVGVGQAREGRENEEVTDQALHLTFRPELQQPLKFLFRQIAALHLFEAVLVGSERIGTDRTGSARQGDDVLEGDHIDPDRIVLQARRGAEILLESIDHRNGDISDADVFQMVPFPDEGAQMPVHHVVALIALVRASVSDHLSEIFIVFVKHVEEHLLSVRCAQCVVFQPFGSD